MLAREFLPRILTARVYDLAVQTPLGALKNLSAETGASVWLKREDLQPIFSFKLRGAANKLFHMSEQEKKRGVIAASSPAWEPIGPD